MRPPFEPCKAESPWTYYRGAAAVMAADLAGSTNTGLAVQLCGDAHVLNFGLWATPERQLSFDLRDFDETLRGPFEWDVKRLSCQSGRAGARQWPVRRHGPTSVRNPDCAPIATGSRTMHRLGNTRDLVRPRDRRRPLQVFEPEERERFLGRLEKRARRRTSAGAARKLTRVVNGRTRIVDDPPIRVRLDGKVSEEDLRLLQARSSRRTATAFRTNAATYWTGSPSSTWSGRSSA